MTEAALSLAVGAGALVLALIVIPLTCRAFPRFPPVLVHGFAAVAAEVAALAVGSLAADEFPVWPATAVIGFGAVANLFVFSAIYKSVSLRMLVFLSAQPGQLVKTETLVERVGRAAVAGRVALLRESGLVERLPDGRYRITERGQRLARQLSLVQRLFGIHRSGLYLERNL